MEKKNLANLLRNKYTESSTKVYEQKTVMERFFSNIYQAFGVRPRYEFDEIPMGNSASKRKIEKILEGGGSIIIKIANQEVASEEEAQALLKDPKKHIKVQTGTRPSITIINPKIKGESDKK